MCESYESLSFHFIMQPSSLLHLAVLKVCEDFDDGTTLQRSLSRIVPRPVYDLIAEEHIRSCMRVILAYYFYNGHKYCRDCVQPLRPVRDQYQSVQIIGPIQISNWQKIEQQHRCVSCSSVPYMLNGRAPALLFRCQCVV